MRSSRVASITRVHTPVDNNGLPGATRNPNAALPADPANRPLQNYYARSPGGSYYHDEDGSETPISVANPWPSSSSGMGFTQNREAHGHTQHSTQPAYQGGNAQLVGPSSLIGRMHYPSDTNTSRQATQHANPANDPTNRGDPTPNHQASQLSEEIRRHDSVVLAEYRRRDQWSQEESNRYAQNIVEMFRRGEPDFVTGFLEREDERERRERQGSTDDDE